MSAFVGQAAQTAKVAGATRPGPERLAQAERQGQVCVIDDAGPGRHPAWVRYRFRGPLGQLADAGLLTAEALGAAALYERDFEAAMRAPVARVRLDDAPRTAGAGPDWLDRRIAAAERLRAADDVLGGHGAEIVRAALGLGREAGRFAAHMEALFPAPASQPARRQRRSKTFRQAAAAAALAVLLARLEAFYARGR